MLPWSARPGWDSHGRPARPAACGQHGRVGTWNTLPLGRALLMLGPLPHSQTPLTPRTSRGRYREEWAGVQGRCRSWAFASSPRLRGRGVCVTVRDHFCCTGKFTVWCAYATFVRACVVGRSDNCPRVPNPYQANRDGDKYGDACEYVPAPNTASAQESEPRSPLAGPGRAAGLVEVPC